jgi:LemA protein
MARMVYNDTATKLNRIIRQWPSSFVAGMLGFKERDYFSVNNAEKREIPVDQL